MNEEHENSKFELSKEITDRDLTDQITEAQHRLDTGKHITEAERSALIELIANARKILEELRSK